MAEDKGIPDGETKESSPPLPVAKKKGKGLLSRIWNAIFRTHGDDFEKRLEHISKEEAAVLSRMKRRSQTWRRMIRNFIAFSVILEVPRPLPSSLYLCESATLTVVAIVLVLKINFLWERNFTILFHFHVYDVAFRHLEKLMVDVIGDTHTPRPTFLYILPYKL